MFCLFVYSCDSVSNHKLNIKETDQFHLLSNIKSINNTGINTLPETITLIFKNYYSIDNCLIKFDERYKIYQDISDNILTNFYHNEKTKNKVYKQKDELKTFENVKVEQIYKNDKNINFRNTNVNTKKLKILKLKARGFFKSLIFSIAVILGTLLCSNIKPRRFYFNKLKEQSRKKIKREFIHNKRARKNNNKMYLSDKSRKFYNYAYHRRKKQSIKKSK